MKLFKCSNCGSFSRDADTTIVLRVRIILHRDQTWSTTGEGSKLLYHEKIEKLDLSSTLCLECGKCSLELVEVECCPHEAGADCWNYYGATRRCRLCGEEQMAKTITFE